MAFEPFAPFGLPRQRRSSYPYTPEEEENLLAQWARPVVSGISAVSNLLGLPGSVVRDILAGQNPLDQFLSPLSHQNRTSGRELLTRLGVTNANKAGGLSDWWSDPGEAASDLGGFAAEVLLDPFFFASGPTKALVSAPFKGGSKAVARTVGRTKLGRTVANLADEGKRLLRANFDARVKGMRPAEAQEVMEGLTARQHGARQEELGEFIPLLAKAHRMGLTTPEGSRRLAQALEGTAKEPIDDLSEFLGPIRKSQDEVQQARDRWGEAAVLNDRLPDGTLLDFRHRSKNPAIVELERKGGLAPEPGDAKPFGAKDITDTHRKEYVRGYAGGTPMVNEVLTNPKWQDILGAADLSAQSKKARLTRAIRREYGPDQIVPEFIKRGKQTGKLGFEYADPSGVTRKKLLSDDEFARATPTGNPHEYVYEEMTNNGPRQLTLRAMTGDRHKAIARELVNRPYLNEIPLFSTNPIVDAFNHKMSASLSDMAKDSVAELLTKPKVLGEVGHGQQTVRQLLSKMGQGDHGKFATETLKKMNVEADPDTIKGLLDSTVRDDIFKAVTQHWSDFKVPEEVGTLAKLVGSGTSAFKAGVLTWPSRYIRDVMSGMVRNVESGLMGVSDVFRDGTAAHKLIQGGTVPGLAELPEVQKWLQRTGRQINDQNAADAVREMFASSKADPFYLNTDSVNLNEAENVGVEEMLGLIPGHDPSFNPASAASYKKLGRMALGQEPGTTKNPFHLRGMIDRTGEVQRKSRFGLAAGGDWVGKYSDDINRLAPFITGLRKGENPAEWMNRIQHAQVNYNPKTFTKLEQKLKLLFPFYSFSSRQIPYIFKQLTEKPGGRLAQLIRAEGEMAHDDPTLPEHVRRSLSVPVEQLDDGTTRYLTGLGLMHEDPLAFIGGGVRGAGLEAISRLNPLLKFPLEWSTGESFFQRGPLGGRNLEEMDPTIGRTISNVGDLLTGNRTEAAEPVPNAFFEALAANSPLTRVLSTARTLTDPRKYEGKTGGAAILANLLTGMRVSDVDERVRDAQIDEHVQQQMMELPGSRTFERPYVPTDTLAQWETKAPQRAEYAKEMKEVLKVLGERAKRREKEKEEREKRRARLLNPLF